MKRTQDEIAVQIAALKLERKSLPERSAFGTNNWSMIDAKLDILQSYRLAFGRSAHHATEAELMRTSALPIPQHRHAQPAKASASFQQ